MNGGAFDLAWQPPGPISARFIQSTAFDQILNGPIGSGKTTTVLMKAIYLALAQPPSPRRRIRFKGSSIERPVRMFKLTAVRDDYRQLWRSTIPSWHELLMLLGLPGRVEGARNAPANHVVNFLLDDGTAVEFIVDFVAIGDNDIEEFMRGYPTTAFYLNERDTLDPKVAEHAKLRVGRYPAMLDGGPAWRGILSDCNAPIVDSEFYNKEFVERDEASGLFRLPGARNPGAENLHNLPAGYYDTQIAFIRDPYLIKRMVDNQPAPSRAGKPVHEDFDDFHHVAPAELAAIEGLPLTLGFDAGLDPAMALTQKLGTGRWNVIDELASSHGTGAVQFAGMVNELLMDRYPGWHRIPTEHEREWGYQPRMGLARPNIRAWCDPAATYGGDQNSAAEADRTWCELVSYHTGIRIQPAPTNNVTDRRAGLTRVLGRKDGFRLSPRCKMIRAGLAGQFRYRRMQLAREERYTDEVDKNQFSHVCEALEYALMSGGELAEVHERRQQHWDTLRNWGQAAQTPNEEWRW